MDISQQKAEFSLAYVHAVATVAGFALYDVRVDDESVDCGVAKRGGGGTVKSPRLELQLKCTERNVLKADGIHFPLKGKNYDDLRGTNLHVPKILVVLLVPDRVGDWVNHSDEEMCLKHCAWWLSLAGAAERGGVETPTVILPPGQRFSPAALEAIMARIGRKENV